MTTLKRPSADEPVKDNPVEIHMSYFEIRTTSLESFLAELKTLCEKFAVKNERDQPDYAYDWEAI